MITTSVRLGAMSANADPKKLRAITKFGYALGLAFQVIDDILDVTQTSEKLGKSAGKDIAAQKATYPAVIGLEASRAEARRLTNAAQNALKIFGKEAEPLRELANYLLARGTDLIWGAQASGPAFRVFAKLLASSVFVSAGTWLRKDFSARAKTSLRDAPPTPCGNRITRARDLDRSLPSPEKFQSSSRNIAANAIMAALSVHSQGSATRNSIPFFWQARRAIFPAARDYNSRRRSMSDVAIWFAARAQTFFAQDIDDCFLERRRRDRQHVIPSVSRGIPMRYL